MRGYINPAPVAIGEVLFQLKQRMMAGRAPGPIVPVAGQDHWKCPDCMRACQCDLPLKHDRCGLSGAHD